jgi:hypothetical protein
MQVQECLSAAMDDFELATDACRELDDVGFIIVPGPVPTDELDHLRATYDAAITDALPTMLRLRVRLLESEISSIAARISTDCTCIRQFSRLAVA